MASNKFPCDAVQVEQAALSLGDLVTIRILMLLTSIRD